MTTRHPIRAYREANKLSVSDLASRIGVSRNTVNRWEKGDRLIDRKLRPAVSRETGISEAVLEGIAQSIAGAAND